MRKNTIAIMVMLALALGVTGAVAETVTVTVSSQGVESADNQMVVSVALPQVVVGKRVDRVVLEVPISLGESTESAFNDFPLIELYEGGSEMPKQTALLDRGFAGSARFDVTRFVRAWSTTDARQFVLGALSESNGTVFTLGATPARWSNGEKARLIIEYRDRDGRALTSR